MWKQRRDARKLDLRFRLDVKLLDAVSVAEVLPTDLLFDRVSTTEDENRLKYCEN